MIPFVQFKKREKCPWRSDTSSEVASLELVSSPYSSAKNELIVFVISYNLTKLHFDSTTKDSKKH